MATHDYIIANASGAAVRADLNNALAAIVSNNSSPTEPATTYSFMWWADTTAGQLKLRNSTNTDWVVIQELDGTMLMEDGTAAAPGLSFASDVNTGLFSAGADQLGISAGGVERAEFGTTEVVFNDSGADVDFRVEGDTVSSLLFVDAGNDRVGIGTNAPDAKLNVHLADTDTSVYFHGGGTRGLKINDETIGNDGDHTKFTKASGTGEYSFSNSSREIVRFTSDGKVAIGTTTPTANMEVKNTSGGDLIKAQGADSDTFTIRGTDNAIVLDTRNTTNGLKFQIQSTTYASLATNGTFNFGAVALTSNITQTSTAPQHIFQETGSTYGNTAWSLVRDSDNFSIRWNNAAPYGLTCSTSGGSVSNVSLRGSALSMDSSNRLIVPTVYSQTGSGSTVVVTPAGFLRRSSSSIKYKKDVETIENSYSDALLNCRPVWYREKNSDENTIDSTWGYWGFIAEEVAEIDPRLVHWKDRDVSFDDENQTVTTPCDLEPEDVAYERFVPHLINLIKRQKKAIEALEARVAVLEGVNAAPAEEVS